MALLYLKINSFISQKATLYLYLNFQIIDRQREIYKIMMNILNEIVIIILKFKRI